MSFHDLGLLLFPQWLRDWLIYEFLPMLGLSPYQISLGLIRGLLDAVLILGLLLGLLSGGRTYMSTQYTLPPEVQSQVIKWSPVADVIARDVDIPPEVPLVLWFKEAGMKAENPSLCTGIIGAYDLVQSGEHGCFTPGPISDVEVMNQLRIGAQEYKKRCPQSTYYTVDSETIKSCYFAYNAGITAAATGSADNSAYVMNNYDADHQNMIYQDIVLGTVRVQQLGAWPAHLAMQGIKASALDEPQTPTWVIGAIDMGTRLYDWLDNRFNNLHPNVESEMVVGLTRQTADCIGEPSTRGRLTLRPSLNPVSEAPILTQDIHGCEYALPGIDISSHNRSALLQAPMPGELTTYTDQWYNTTIRIENEEWIMFLLHPRSYLLTEGTVERGQAIGVMGAIGVATGPHVHISIYDKQSETFVDPAQFMP